MPKPGHVPFIGFAVKVMIAHTVTYFVVGSLAYQLITKPFYEGPDPLFAGFMRTPADPALWAHVMRWFLPAQLLRGLLMAAALWPFHSTVAAWSWRRRFLALAGLYFIFGYWATAVAAPGTIEGLVYLRPEFTPRVHLIVQPEILIQAHLWSAWLAAWITPRPSHV